MKKVLGFWVLSLLVVTAFVLPVVSSLSSSSTPDVIFPRIEESVTVTASSKKLKGRSYNPCTEKMKSTTGNINLEDYHLIDPAPSSRATIKSAPIEHGTPLMPYIPKPTPPYHPKHGESPSPA